MKALIVINGLGTGGAEHSLAALLPDLLRADIRPVLAALHRRGEGVQEGIVASGVPVHFAPASSFRTTLPWLRALVYRERPDLVHTTLFEADVAGRVAARSLAPVLTSLVNTSYAPERFDADPRLDRLKIRTTRAIDGFTARRLTAHFHAITWAVADAAIRALRIDARRMSVVERGRDPAVFRPRTQEDRAAARRALGLPQTVPVVATVGRQEHQKGQRYLIDALALVTRRHPDVRLLIAGRSGNASSALTAAIRRHGLTQRVHLLGHLADVRPVLAAADVFAFPSVYEGLGGALIEALACEVPVVVSDLPVLREVLRSHSAGLVTRPQDATTLAAALERVLGDEALASALARHGRLEFERRFTLERSNQLMIDLYRSVSAGAPRDVGGDRMGATDDGRKARQRGIGRHPQA